MIEQDFIKKWVESSLSTPVSALGGLPACPYAHDAIKKNKVRSRNVSAEEALFVVEEEIIKFYNQDSVEVTIIIIENWQKIEGKKVTEFALEMREKYFYNDVWLLSDHPENIEVLEGFCFNQGEVLLFMIQKLSQLVVESKLLEKRDYYKNWPNDYYEEVVGTRHQHYLKMKKNLTKT